MRRDKVIYLISDQQQGKNDFGDPITVPGSKRKIFAAKKSIKTTEFYQAAVSDFKPEMTFEIWLSEYKGESTLEFNEKDYKIIRTYEKNDKEIELVCEGMSSDGNA